MLTPEKCTHLYGNPQTDQHKFETNWMVLTVVPDDLLAKNKALPKKLYCHRAFGPQFIAWLKELDAEGVLHEIKSYGGCWAIRMQRGFNVLSIHSWALAVDFNVDQNPLGLTADQCRAKGLTPWSAKFLEVSRKYFDCGADWVKRPDGMHFQLKG